MNGLACDILSSNPKEEAGDRVESGYFLALDK
jgi:hypothetical protein